MGLFDRFRSAERATEDYKNKTDAAEQGATHLIEEGQAHEAENRIDEALQCYLEAIQLAPTLARAHLNHGNALLAKGDLQGALEAFRTAIKHKPDYAGAYYNIGNALVGNVQLAEAVTNYRRALEIKPDYAEVCCSLGIALKQLGKFDEGMASFQRALKINPDLVEARTNLGLALGELYNRGNALLNAGEFEGAIASFSRVLEIEPNLAEAHYNLANALNEIGQTEYAVTSYRRALQIKPDYAEAHSNLGVALQDLGRLDEAVTSYRQALEIKPDMSRAHNNLGTALKDLGLHNAALESYQRAVEFDPGFAEVYNNFGILLTELGQPDAALAAYNKALEIRPCYPEAYSNMLYLHAFTRDISPELECSLAANWENLVLSEGERIAAHEKFLSFAPPSRAGRKLKLGIVSAEIGQHAVAEFLEPFLERLDRSRFHVTLFPTVTRLEPRATRLKNLADEFKSLDGMPDSDAADLIRANRIDILVDTTAHMRNCRLGIFAHRAAPVQCHYIGYHGTTGLTEMDWFIADEVLLPPACDAHFREGIWRLPRLWIAYRGEATLPESRWMPSPDGAVWLGSFNNLTKVREKTLALWARVMNAIPESRLLLKDSMAKDSAVQDRIRAELCRHGISAERVEFAGMVPDWRSHMALYDRLDIALDTIPLNSGTTAFDALWMGVPLVALEGDWMGARMTNAILKALGRPEWVAQSEDEYVAIVAALARDVEGRKTLRVAQRAQMASSQLCDANGLSRALEDAFEAMFDRWVEERNSTSKVSGAR